MALKHQSAGPECPTDSIPKRFSTQDQSGRSRNVVMNVKGKAASSTAMPMADRRSDDLVDGFTDLLPNPIPYHTVPNGSPFQREHRDCCTRRGGGHAGACAMITISTVEPPPLPASSGTASPPLHLGCAASRAALRLAKRALLPGTGERFVDVLRADADHESQCSRAPFLVR